jgi:hypothetical protein
MFGTPRASLNVYNPRGDPVHGHMVCVFAALFGATRIHSEALTTVVLIVFPLVFLAHVRLGCVDESKVSRALPEQVDVRLSKSPTGLRRLVITDDTNTPLPRIVDRATWRAELDTLGGREKAHTDAGDALAAARRRLPMVKVDATLRLTGPDAR